jgi:hypothetical protein
MDVEVLVDNINARLIDGLERYITDVFPFISGVHIQKTSLPRTCVLRMLFGNLKLDCHTLLLLLTFTGVCFLYYA